MLFFPTISNNFGIEICVRLLRGQNNVKLTPDYAMLGESRFSAGWGPQIADSGEEWIRFVTQCNQTLPATLDKVHLNQPFPVSSAPFRQGVSLLDTTPSALHCCLTS